MKRNLCIKIMALLIMCFFVVTQLSPAIEISRLYENDDDIEPKVVNNTFSEEIRRTSSSEESIVGEKLDSTDYGPCIIEHMDDCIARDLLQRYDKEGSLEENKKQHGTWVIPSIEATYCPHSGKHNVINKEGDTRMGIAFPTKVDLHGAWLAGQGGGKGVWASSVRVIGYIDGKQIQTTDWFEDIDDTPSWFAMNLQDVDRIIIEATPVFNGAGWYAMDDLTYTSQDNTKQPIIVDFEDCYFNQDLKGSNYAGLTWETGTGNFYYDQDEAPGISSSSFIEKNDLTKFVKSKSDFVKKNRAFTPPITNNYSGVIRGDAGSWSYPPDSCGAAGPNHYVETVNRNFAVYNKSTGEELINILLGSFLPGSNGDPRVQYDQYSERWFVIVCDFQTQIYLAVSISDDPTGDWFKVSFVVSQGSDAGRWPDYPTLGVDEIGVYTASYMVGGNSMSIFALDKAPLIAEEPSLGDVYAFRDLPWEGAIQPVHTFGTTEGEYFVSVRSSTAIRVRLLTDLLSDPILTELGSASIPGHSEPPDAPALGSTTPLDTVGSRLMNAVYRDGYIWTAHCIGLDGVAASRWYKINVSGPSLADYGTINDTTMYYFFPSIMVNAGGDVVMGFSGSNSDQYAAAYYTGRLANDPPGTMNPPTLLKEGEDTYNLIDSYGRNRWGDYSLCSLDPTNEYTIWTIQEYAHSHNESGVYRWGTWIGEIGNLPPYTPDAPEGPDEGRTDIEYPFTVVTSDPEANDIYYFIDWGDSTINSWFGPYESGEEAEAFHAWTYPGEYNITVKAKDVYGGVSKWSNPTSIKIAQSALIDINPIQGGLFKVSTIIKNNGEIDANNVSWSINFNGGAFIGKETSGTATISAGEEISIKSNFVLGFGPTKVKVIANDIEGASDKREQSGFILFFYITINPGG